MSKHPKYGLWAINLLHQKQLFFFMDVFIYKIFYKNVLDNTFITFKKGYKQLHICSQSK